MIDIIKQTPYEYSNQSRDYQVLARLYTALFNLVKMYIDNLKIWNNDIDNKLIDLRASTLNFEPKHYWDLKDLEAVTSSFKYLVRNKGTAKALEYCVNILMKIENISSEDIDRKVVYENNNVTIYTPENLLTIGIVEDLVKYLLPAGVTYDIIKFKTTDAGGLQSTLRYIDRNIVWNSYKYNKYMQLGHETEIVEGKAPEDIWTKITSEDKIWFGSTIGSDIDYAPYDSEGIRHSTGITIYDSEGNSLIVTDSEGQEMYISTGKTDGDLPEEIGNFINQTFVTRIFDSQGNIIDAEKISSDNGEI